MKLKRALGLLSLLALAGGCRKDASCRPGSLFLTLTFDGAAVGADALHVTLTDSQGSLNAQTNYQGGSTLQVDFPPGRYLGGESVTLLVIALQSGVELARVEKDDLILPKSCAAVKIALGASDDLGVGDLSVVGDGPVLPPGDLTGIIFDFSIAHDLSKPGNGSPCSSGDQCASTFCVDGVCCNVACTEQCEACDVDTFVGQCVPVVSGQPHGTRTGCAGADGGSVCGGSCSPAARNACSYPGPATTCANQSCPAGSTKYLASGCDQAGGCTPQETRDCSPNVCAGNNDCMGACMSDGDCSSNPAGHFCDSGICTPKKPRGHTCAAASECTSGSCADGVCCNNDCTNQCEACAESGSAGTCIKVVGAVRTASPPPTRTACVGSGECVGTCNGTSTTCVNPGNSTPCGTQTCTSGSVTPIGGCNMAGGCTQTSSPCSTNYCNGNACGPCANDPQCGAGNWCNLSVNGGTCQTKRVDGSSCSAGNQCANGNCVGTICCHQACGGSLPACSSDGTTCICSGGSCGSGQVCMANGTCCNHGANCSGKNCGSDGCGGNCGVCAFPAPDCVSQICVCSNAADCGAGGYVCDSTSLCCLPSCPACVGGTMFSNGCGGFCSQNCLGSCAPPSGCFMKCCPSGLSGTGPLTCQKSTATNCQ